MATAYYLLTCKKTWPDNELGQVGISHNTMTFELIILLFLCTCLCSNELRVKILRDIICRNQELSFAFNS